MNLKIYSEALSPTFVVLAVLAMLSLFPPFPLGKLDNVSAFIIGLFFLVLLPFASVFLEYLLGKTDLDVTSRALRVRYYKLWALFFAGGALLFLLEGAYGLFAFSAAMAEVSAAMHFMNKLKKASLHVATVTAAVVTLLFAYGAPALLLSPIIPFIAWVRLKLKAHTLVEVVYGFVLGVALTTVTLAATLGA